MLSELTKTHIEKLANDFRTNFEENTGKKIGTGAYFDMTEIINYYGGIIEFSDLYEENYRLDSYICKVEKDGFDFKIVIDNKKAESLKKVDEKGRTCYGDWNLFIMKLFYIIIMNHENLGSMKDGEIIFPDSSDVTLAMAQKKLKLKENKYKLFGTMNLFDLVPDFVYAVFENDGKYYVQKSDNSIEIDSFYEICGENHTNRIKPLTSSFNKLIGVKEYYTIGDEALVAFQTSKDNYFIGNRKAFINFIKDIEIENEILSKRIADFKIELQKNEEQQRVKKLTKNEKKI